MLKDKRKDAKRLVRKGRRIYGAVYALASGEELYLAWRKTSEIFRGGEKVLSTAVADGKASWAIDDDTLLDLRREGVKFVGVLVTDTGDKYITTLATFLDRTKAKVMNYESRGGAVQRYLPLGYFTKIAGKTKIR